MIFQTMLFYSFLVLCVGIELGVAMNYQYARKLYNAVLSNYTRNVKPRKLSSDSVKVNIDFSINAILDFDEKSGVLSFQGKFTLKWWDEIIMWNKSDHGNLDMVQLSIHDVWIPHVAIGNSVSYHSLYQLDNYFDSQMIYVTYYDDGSAKITSSGVWKTSCNTDVSKFPFDVHECDVTIDAQESEKDLILLANPKEVYVNYTTMHSEFKIKKTTVRNVPVHAGVMWSQLTYSISLARKPLFMMMNLVVPVYIISVANLLVFLLPIDSSDRVAFSVTMLLTFTVFMTMVSDQLPATDRLSNFNMFLLLQMVFSTLITISILCIHYVYRKEDKETEATWINRIITSKHKGKNSVEPVEKVRGGIYVSRWKTVAKNMNTCFLFIFALIILVEFAFFYLVNDC